MGKHLFYSCMIFALALLEHQTSQSQNKLFPSSCKIYYFRTQVN